MCKGDAAVGLVKADVCCFVLLITHVDSGFAAIGHELDGAARRSEAKARSVEVAT